MPLSHVTKLFAVQDAKLYPLLTDPAGGAATYDEGFDIPGIKSLELSGDIETKDLRGDNTLLDSDSVLMNVNLKIMHAKLSLDVQAAMLGGAVVDSGTTPTQKVKWALNNSTKLGVFKLEAVSVSADPVLGNVLMRFHKCRLASYPGGGFVEEDYAIPEFDVRTLPLISTGDWIDYEINETAVELEV